jgi:chromatin remodeling complex protein RSC6
MATNEKKKSKQESAFMKPVEVSEALAEIVGSQPIPRTEVTKLVWDYIKKHKLQDPKDKRTIVPDAKLGKVIGTKPINMFKMTSELAKHIRSS